MVRCEAGASKVTTQAANGVERPLDLVNRDFAASRPNQLWVSDLTYVRIGPRFAYVAFVVDAFSRRIVGWQISNSLRSDLSQILTFGPVSFQGVTSMLNEILFHASTYG